MIDPGLLGFFELPEIRANGEVEGVFPFGFKMIVKVW